MTIEESITLLEAARKTMYLPKSKGYISDLGYALDMAIQSLEAWEKCKREIQFIKEAEEQVYGYGSWNFVGKIEDVIDKYLKKIENDS